MPKKIRQNKQKLYCIRCQRVGHLAKDCYTLICDYCRKVGHDILTCRSFHRDKKFIMNSAKQVCKDNFIKGTPVRRNKPGTRGITSNIDTDISSLSTIGAYREYLISDHRDVIEISTPELKGEKAKMMISTNCPITMIKIGKLKDDVTAAKEVLSLEDARGTRVETICLICLCIHINNKTVLHPCRVIPDDFYIETDGILGDDFMCKSKIQPEKHIEVAGIQIPLIDNVLVRGIERADELTEISYMDTDSETLTESS